MTNSRAVWHIDQQRASLQGIPWSCEFNVAHPCDGLHNVHYRGGPIRGFVALQLGDRDNGWAARDCYTRGQDLVIDYHPIESITWQLQLRAHLLERRLSLDLLITTHTSLLDGDPSLTMATAAAGAEFLVLPLNGGPPRPLSKDLKTTSGFLIRFQQPEVSYVEMVFPSDFGESQFSAGSDSIAYGLFQNRLEKGVIRRARIRSLFLPRHQDESIMRAEFADFSHAAPPLTV